MKITVIPERKNPDTKCIHGNSYHRRCLFCDSIFHQFLSVRFHIGVYVLAQSINGVLEVHHELRYFFDGVSLNEDFHHSNPFFFRERHCFAFLAPYHMKKFQTPKTTHSVTPNHSFFGAPNTTMEMLRMLAPRAQDSADIPFSRFLLIQHPLFLGTLCSTMCGFVPSR